MVNYWLIVHDLPSYEAHPDKIGLNKESAESNTLFKRIREDDRIIYYAKNKEAIGIFKVASDGHLSQKGCWGGKAGDHFIFDISPIYVTPSSLPANIDTTKYGIKTLQGRTAVKLTREQYKDIKSDIIGMSDPEYESGVVALFSKIHQFIGFPYISIVQARFPDCTAVNSKGREVRIEFEEPSNNFDHDYKKCDLIVCWTDTLGKLSKVPVLELSEVIYGH
jgi:hypothetical protein